MLSFLLFAGAIHIDAGKLKKERWPIMILSTLGIVISTFFVGGAVWYLFGLFHIATPFIYCLLFGSLISPTDPIAVLAILKQAKIPSTLEVKISGESLFNDGVAVVILIFSRPSTASLVPVRSQTSMRGLRAKIEPLGRVNA